MRIAVLIRGDRMNAIDQASICLADSLTARGHHVSVVERRPGMLPRDVVGADVLVVPYNPFMWGRWGFAPSLVVDVARLRLTRRAKIVLVVHEPFVPMYDLRSAVMGLYQRLQLIVLMRLAHRRLASIEAWARDLSWLGATGHLPSGSNVPDMRAARDRVRQELGLEGRLAVGSLSTGHPSYLRSHVEAALGRLAAQGSPVSFLCLGAGAPDLVLPENVPAYRPGMVSAERLGELVAASDIFLVPLVDGVSTRRGSLMAALCQGVAMVGTRGPLTDSLLLHEGLVLEDVEAVDHFVTAVTDLAADRGRREAVAHRGRALFEREFTWDRIAEKLLVEAGK